jgi:hypothetical protein
MKLIVPIVIVVLVISVWAVGRSRSQKSGGARADDAPSATKNLYSDLRSQILQGSRSKFGIAPTSKPTEPWGVLMDWNEGRMTLTVVAASDGSASLYFSNGGAYLGGKAEEPIRRAAQRAVEVAGETQPLTHATATFPLPQQGEVIFYLLTDSGVFTASTTEGDLNSVSHPLRRLGDAMQDVVRQYGPMRKAISRAEAGKQSK